MARGFVAGFVKHRGAWVGAWVRVDDAGKRRVALERARRDLAAELADRCGGEAVARRKLVIIDGLCGDGRELIERTFEAMREQSPQETASEVARRKD